MDHPFQYPQASRLRTFALCKLVILHIPLIPCYLSPNYHKCTLLCSVLQTVSGQLIRNTPTQDLLWSYTVQLAATLRAAHASGLALRPAALSATKVRERAHDGL